MLGLRADPVYVQEYVMSYHEIMLNVDLTSVCVICVRGNGILEMFLVCFVQEVKLKSIGNW